LGGGEPAKWGLCGLLVRQKDRKRAENWRKGRNRQKRFEKTLRKKRNRKGKDDRIPKQAPVKRGDQEGEIECSSKETFFRKTGDSASLRGGRA